MKRVGKERRKRSVRVDTSFITCLNIFIICSYIFLIILIFAISARPAGVFNNLLQFNLHNVLFLQARLPTSPYEALSHQSLGKINYADGEKFKLS